MNSTVHMGTFFREAYTESTRTRRHLSQEVRWTAVSSHVQTVSEPTTEMAKRFFVFCRNKEVFVSNTRSISTVISTAGGREEAFN